MPKFRHTRCWAHILKPSSSCPKITGIAGRVEVSFSWRWVSSGYPGAQPLQWMFHDFVHAVREVSKYEKHIRVPTPTSSNEMLLLKSFTFLIGGYIFKASATLLVLARTTGGYSMHFGDRFTHNVYTKVVAVEFSAWSMIQNRYSVNYI